MKCGCKIETHAQGDMEIIFCALHASADQLANALEDMLIRFERAARLFGSSQPTTDFSTQKARAALKAARGEK